MFPVHVVECCVQLAKWRQSTYDREQIIVLLWYHNGQLGSGNGRQPCTLLDLTSPHTVYQEQKYETEEPLYFSPILNAHINLLQEMLPWPHCLLKLMIVC